MAVVLPPSTEAIPDGYVVPANLVVQGALNTGDVLTFGLASSARATGVTAPSWDLVLTEGAGGPAIVNRDTLYSEQNLSFTYTATRPMAWALYLVGGGGPAFNSHGTAFGVFVDMQPASVTYCAYGTELQPTASFVYYLTPGLIDVWLGRVGMPWLAPLFTAFWFSTFNVSELCGSGPPPFPPVDLSTLEASAETVLQVLKCIAWPSVCQCKPGTPNPTPYPPPSATQPTGWPLPPTFDCSGTDLCKTLLELQRQVAALQATAGETLGLATLLQRYGMPFAYIPGPTHQNVRASGSFQVSRLVGVKVHVLAWPTSNQTFSGTPTYITDLGWLSLETADGLVDEIRLTRLDQTWFPRMMPLATLFGITLREGVRVDIQELIAEP